MSHQDDETRTATSSALTHLESGHPTDALPPLEKAANDTTPGRREGLQRVGRWLLGRARVEARLDAARGIEQVKAARAAMEIAGDIEELKELDAWLAKH